VLGDLDAVVGHPALGEVVGADLLRALAGADLPAAVRGLLGAPALQLVLVEAGAQHLHRPLAVLQLGLLVLHRDDEARRLVRDAHRGVGGVDRLPARARRAVDVDLEVVGVDLDVDLLGLGEHGDGGGGCVDAALRLGLGHALHAVGPALELEHRVRAVAADLHRVGAVGGVERLGGEAAALRVAGEHAEQVAGPQARLLAAGAAADLDDHVLVVARVALDHRDADLLPQALGAPARDAQLLAQLGVVAALVEQLLGALGIGHREPPLLGELRRGRELVEAPPGIREAAAVGDHLGGRQLALDLGVAGFDLLYELLDHPAESSGGTRTAPGLESAPTRGYGGAVGPCDPVDPWMRGEGSCAPHSAPQSRP
jgi:hypothetical protein